jgi:ubiquitin-like 1-activating enzyme E1 B
METPQTKKRYSGIRKILGNMLFEKVQKARVLVVGAGGIGCELLKNLVMGGFVNIEVIDLDTIDVSNLNRQFLFRPQHVSQSKSAIAKESVLKFNPDVKIESHHGNVKSEEFNVEFFKKFSIVLNALDNVSARRHVNRLCLAAGVPLIEAGSTGYIGQVYAIKKSETECYDCRPKPTQKKYPICTIRSTPEKPVHCIVWGKELFKFLFGNMEESMLNEVESEDSDKSVIASTAGVRPTNDFSEEKLNEYAIKVFQAFFNEEIKKKLAMKDQYKGASHKPTPLDLNSINYSNDFDAVVKKLCNGGGTVNQQKPWTIGESSAVFLHLIKKTYLNPTSRAQIGFMEFDKDDALALDFVTAASNLRAHIFNIPRQSPFHVKGIAGNIVHAIATTNAIVAGFEVLECYKILRGDPVNKLKYQAVQTEPTRKGYIVSACSLEKQNPNCYVCSGSTLALKIDTKKNTLENLVKLVLKSSLGFNEPEFTIGPDPSKLFYYPDAVEDDEDNEFDFMKKKLCDLPGGGMQDNSSFTVTDLSQGDLKASVQVVHTDEDDFDDDKFPDKFQIIGASSLRSSSSSKSKPNDNEKMQESKKRKAKDAEGGDSDILDTGDDIIILDDIDTPLAKKQKVLE